MRWLGLGGLTVKNLRRLACKFDLDQFERKSSRVNATGARKPWRKPESQVDASWGHASSCDPVWPGLKRSDYNCISCLKCSDKFWLTVLSTCKHVIFSIWYECSLSFEAENSSLHFIKPSNPSEVVERGRGESQKNWVGCDFPTLFKFDALFLTVAVGTVTLNIT